jgi:hypothetical protein
LSYDCAPVKSYTPRQHGSPEINRGTTNVIPGNNVVGLNCLSSSSCSVGEGCARVEERKMESAIREDVNLMFSRRGGGERGRYKYGYKLG